MINLASLPIVQRELLVSSRKRVTFWSRIIAALGAFVAVVLIVGIEPDLMAAGALGAKLFRCLAMPAFFVCLFGGALLTADCLSVEKREGTLGLLFLTDLSGYDVVFGKFVAKSLTGVFCLIAIFPMLAVPILLGGVTGPDFWRIVLVLLNTAFLSLSVGIAVSVLCRDTRNVFAVSFFILFLLSVVPAIVRGVAPRWAYLASLFSPVVSFNLAMRSPMPAPGIFYLSVLTLHALGWLCLLFASARVKTSWLERRKPEVARHQWRERMRGSAPVRLALRRRLLPVNPMLWLESRDRVLRAGLTLLIFIIAVGCWFLNNGRGLHWTDLRVAVIPIFLMHFIFTLLLAFDSASRLLTARRDGMLTVVLATQMSVTEILRGEFLALRRLFGWPLFVLLAYHAVWVFFAVSSSRVSRGPLIVTIGVSVTLVLLANSCSLMWAALFEGLRARRSGPAALKAFGQIILLPMALTGVTTIATRSNLAVTVVLFTLLNLVNAWIFGRSAYERLKHEFRESLTEHRPPPLKIDFNEDFALLK